jgi:hypothetical protein
VSLITHTELRVTLTNMHNACYSNVPFHKANLNYNVQRATTNRKFYNGCCVGCNAFETLQVVMGYMCYWYLNNTLR